MGKVIFRNAFEEAVKKATSSRSMFFTPEHLLLVLLDDDDLRILLASINVDPTSLSCVVMDHVSDLPCFKQGGRQPFFSMAFDRVMHRLGEKGYVWERRQAISASHFLEAYAFESSRKADISPCLSAAVLSERHQEIYCAVYGISPQV